MEIPMYIYFMTLALLASLSLVIQPTKVLYLKLFPFFLLISLAIELVGNYLSSKGTNNVQFYNHLSAFEISFYLFVLSEIIYNTRVKKICKYLVWVYPLCYFLNIHFLQPLDFHSYSYSFGSLLIVYFCIYYIYELFQLPKSIKLITEPPFWISIGLLFFYCCSFPILGLLNYLAKLPHFLQALDTAITLLNVSLYSLLTIALLCRIKIRKSI